jgi:hypothetical protein
MVLSRKQKSQKGSSSSEVLTGFTGLTLDRRKRQQRRR